jgi:hypothetical protein
MSKTITDVQVANHATTPTKKVRARAIIGNAQKGGWVMMLNGKHAAGGTGGAWVSLGTGATLKGGFLEIAAVVIDVQAATNRLSLVVEVDDGATKTKSSITHMGQDGDSAAYSVLVFFT